MTSAPPGPGASAEVLLGVVAAVVLLTLVALGPWLVRDAGTRRRARALGRERPDGARGEDERDPDVTAGVVVALLVAACRAGTSLPRALEAVGGCLGVHGAPDPWAAAARQLVLGASWDAAWAAAGRTVTGPAPEAWELVRDALAPAWERGAAVVPALEGALDELRRRRAARAAEAAGRLGVRLVLPLGLCYLPAFVAVGLVPVLLSYGVGLLAR